MKTSFSRLSAALTALVLGMVQISPASAQTTLADQPIFSIIDVPGNLVMTLSVEYPTANSVANLGNYADSSTYVGYFDPAKCYSYQYNSTTPSSSYFKPAAMAGGANKHSCSQNWSGNFMNWATMATIDPFRWELTGGYRSVDSVSQTILTKAWHSGQGGTGNYPDRGTNTAIISSGNQIPSSVSISSITPFSNWTTFEFRIEGNDHRMVFSSDTTGTTPYTTAYQATTGTNLNTSSPSTGVAYQVYINVDVCDASALGVGAIEGNCVQYGSYYKPQGLIQKYANQIRFGVFGYPNADGAVYQGGLLREPIGYLGPTYPTPLSATVTANTRAEWNGSTGQLIGNPDPASATASGVTNSGVINYINGFGQTTGSYMQDDDVSILYYAAVRYFENLGNVPDWTTGLTTTQLDNFPAVTTWTDPILYSCQKNFILGIGDDHTHTDYNVGGGTSTGSIVKPAAEYPPTTGNDNINQTETWLHNLETLEGVATNDYITASPELSPGDCCGGATYYIAGLAYGTHVNDIRPDLTGTQTISTYWMDVEEYQEAENLNQYYLATKYGGFTVPTGYSTSNTTTPLPLGEWDTSSSTKSLYMNGTYQYPPDNYFLAGNAGLMVTNLNNAFVKISNSVSALSTSFSFTAPNITTNTQSFASAYNPTGWTGTISAYTLSFDSNGNPVDSATPVWTSDVTFNAQVAGSGWQSGRNIATWNGSKGVPFEAANITSAQQLALQPSYSPTLTCVSTSCPYLSYLRGDPSNQVGSLTTGSTLSLRARTLFLGDIVDASLTTVAAPIQTFSDANNPGYSAFKSSHASRPTMVYAGANDGMLHAFVGSSGTEQFAYVPSGLFQGPTGTPQVNGLAELGNPNYVHHFYVDATPQAFDLDLAHTGGSSSTGSWSTQLIGGLGKGGQSFYAIDVTNPSAMSSESAVASAVKWEFTDSTMGYSFGAAVVVKTLKYGWVAILTSGYDNADGYGYLYFINPATGTLLEKVKTPTQSIGMTQASAFVKDYSDDTADSVYVGDLQGQIWRFDLTGTTGLYPQPTLLATLTDGINGLPQPITTAPLIEIHPTTRQRYVMVATGQLLSTNDVIDTQMQDFYAIIDGTATAFKPVTTPITRASLTAETQTQLTTSKIIPSSALGWYTDLGIDSTSGIGWRTIINPVAYNGIVSFTTLLPGNDPCNPGGASRVYALDYSTATSVLQPSSLPYVSYSTTVIDARFTGNNGTAELIVGFSEGSDPLAKVPAVLTGTPATRILNWREIPTVE
jgi:type IV pilus assembly protein PilY1